MPLVKYVANATPEDWTDRISLHEPGEPERILVRGGDPLELSEDEISQISGRYVLEEVSQDEQPAAIEAEQSTATESQPASTGWQTGPVGEAGTTPEISGS